jgi:preprotein translocase subunit SecG
MSQLLHAMPSLCEPPPPLCHAKQTVVDPETQAQLADFGKVGAYPDSVWGPAKWTALQSEILSLPEEIDQHEFCTFKTYLALNARYLPCTNCSRHFAEHLANMPNTREMRTRAGLLRWLTDVHNDVNRRKHRELLTHQQIVAVLNDKAAQKKTTSVQGQEQEQGMSANSVGEALQETSIHVLLVVLLAAIILAFTFFLSRKGRKRA